MSEYQMGKEVQLISQRLETAEALLEQLYNIVDHNLKQKKLVEPEAKK